jgi:hypothetical protein
MDKEQQLVAEQSHIRKLLILKLEPRALSGSYRPAVGESSGGIDISNDHSRKTTCSLLRSTNEGMRRVEN